MVAHAPQHVPVQFVRKNRFGCIVHRLQRLLHDSAPVRVQRQSQHVPAQTIAQLLARRGIAALEKLLRHVVPEDVGGELRRLRQNFLQRGGNLLAARALQPLLDEPAAVLVARELGDVPGDVRERKSLRARLGVLLERLQKRRRRFRVAERTAAPGPGPARRRAPAKKTGTAAMAPVPSVSDAAVVRRVWTAETAVTRVGKRASLALTRAPPVFAAVSATAAAETRRRRFPAAGASVVRAARVRVITHSAVFTNGRVRARVVRAPRARVPGVLLPLLVARVAGSLGPAGGLVPVRGGVRVPHRRVHVVRANLRELVHLRGVHLRREVRRRA